MNTTQNTRRIIAAALVAASAGLALSSCAGQRQLPIPDSDRLSARQVVEQRAAYLDLAERRARMSRDLTQVQTELYRDQAERRIDIGGPTTAGSYLDQAERRAGVGGPVVVDPYLDQAERRLTR